MFWENNKLMGPYWILANVHMLLFNFPYIMK